jgi:hypothetical protein
MAYPWKHGILMSDTYSELVRSKMVASRLLKANEARRMHLGLRFLCCYHDYCHADKEILSSLGDLVQVLTALLGDEPWPTDRASDKYFIRDWSDAASAIYLGTDLLPVENACRWLNNLLWLNDVELSDAIAHNTRKIS